MELINAIVNFRTNRDSEKPLEDVAKKIEQLDLEDFSGVRFLDEIKSEILLKICLFENRTFIDILCKNYT